VALVAVARRREARVWGREVVGLEVEREEEMARCISAVLGPFCEEEVDGVLDDEFPGWAAMFEVILLVVVGGTEGRC